MLFDIASKSGVELYKKRREDLVIKIKEKYQNKTGVIVFISDFEQDCKKFDQESSFFYYSGINEPGVLMVHSLDNNKTVLFKPEFINDRGQWVDSEVELLPENAKKLGVDKVDSLGNPLSGYQVHPFSSEKHYDFLIESLGAIIKNNENIFTIFPGTPYGYMQQRLLLNRFSALIPNFKKSLIDISDLVAGMRRKKDMHEIEKINEAIDITILAHEAAAQAIKAGTLECEVQAAIEYVFTAAGSAPAFPSIVATGKNGTILHYVNNSQELKKSDLVVVDIGAKKDGYCADITRTYPVSGTFTRRQKELYQIVLDVQEYIADLAKPGMWLNNKDEKEKSLHHLAQDYLEKKGYKKYFPHGIGHYLGLDVHDVGGYKTPLQEGDVITIEPGIYIQQESIGIRIEDNYWVVKNGAVCLSEQLPKTIEDIENFMQQDHNLFDGYADKDYIEH